MPVFDFSNPESTTTTTEVTYTTFHSDNNAPRQWAHHSCGVFTNPAKHTAFEFEEEDGIISANILQIDSRFVSLIKWLGENHINVRLSGNNLPDGYAVYKIREIAYGGATKLSAEDGFLQFMMERLFSSSAPLDETLITSVSGQDVIWQLQNPTKYPRKNDATHSVRFLL